MAKHSTVATSDGGKCESHSDIRLDAPQNSIRSGSGPIRATETDCARMVVAHMVELSHTEPPQKPHSGARPKQIVRADGVLPPHPQASVRPLHLSVISKKTASRSDSAFHSRKNYASGFSVKNVRTSSRNCRNLICTL